MPDSVPSAPPAEMISASLKLEAASLRVKLMVAVSPILKAVLSDVIVMVGATVSTVIES